MTGLLFDSSMRDFCIKHSEMKKTWQSHYITVQLCYETKRLPRYRS